MNILTLKDILTYLKGKSLKINIDKAIGIISLSTLNLYSNVLYMKIKPTDETILVEGSGYLTAKDGVVVFEKDFILSSIK